MNLFSTLRPILLPTLFAALVLSARAAETPNIILIMTDDQGYGEMSCHGNPLLKTPNIDRLHAESVRFTDFHVSPTCSPTRSSLMTGRHEFKNGVTHTINERERMTLSATTLAQVLKTVGYTTGIFGKWHLGDEPAYQPNKRGFDEVFIHGAGGIGQTYVGSCGDAPNNKYFDPAILHNGVFEKTKGFCTDVFFRQAQTWMAQKRGQSRSAPFFAYITPNAPHGPFISPGDRYTKQFIDAGLTPDQAAYYGMIVNIDENVGTLLGKLKDWGIERDTIVIFMTDNGHSVGALYNAGMRAQKGTPYQGGTRVPAFWRWPGKFPAGKDVAALTAHVDVLPTLIELTGAKAPRGVSFDGRSFLPLLRDTNAPWADRFLFTHVGRWDKGKASESKFRNCAVRTARFRLVNNTELHDILADPGEKQNVIEKFPAEVAKMRAAYDKWWEEVQPLLVNENAPIPPVNPFKELYWKQFGGGPAAGEPAPTPTPELNRKAKNKKGENLL